MGAPNQGMIFNQNGWPFTDNMLFGWERRELSPRDHSLDTVATLVSTGKISGKREVC
ncbi:hypothetical protein [Rhizobium tubonense]|uniref:hypothetical protein n=1 Tax=Rhizobium tubonense TaxID=484088 RepID=UPI0019D48FC0|nr:hypothetical protein [Rhizobium tubonense]